MLILKVLAVWSIIAIFTTLLVGETLRRMGSATPDRPLAVIARPAPAHRMRRTNNTAQGVR